MGAVLGMIIGVYYLSTLGSNLRSPRIPYQENIYGEGDDVFSCADLDSATGMWACFYEGSMVSMIALVYNIGNIMLLGGSNAIRGILGGMNDNGYIVPSHNKLIFLGFYLFPSYL